MEEFDEFFEAILDDMRINDEKRPALRAMTFDVKWNQIVRQGVIMNIQTNFQVLSALQLLKEVSFLENNSRFLLVETAFSQANYRYL